MEPIHVVLSSCFQRGTDFLSHLPSSHVHMLSTAGRLEELRPIQQCYINRIQKTYASICAEVLFQSRLMIIF